MAATGASYVAGGFLPMFGRDVWSIARGLRTNPISVSIRPSAVIADQTPAPGDSEGGRLDKMREGGRISKGFDNSDVAGTERRSLRDYFEQSKELIKSDGGPPRWFSPLECGSPLESSPLLLFSPGIDGVGLGLILHHQTLGKVFDVWCLHIPVSDRTTFTELVKLVETTVRTENHRSPNRPIYLVGESLGACLSLAVAARNPDLDLALILANPATSVKKSPLQAVIPLLSLMPDKLPFSLLFVLGLITGDPLRMVFAKAEKGLPPQQRVGEIIQCLVSLSSHLSVLSDIFPKETLLWKLKMLQSVSTFSNSRLHAIKAETLVLSSGKIQLLSSQRECERLFHALPNCEIRKFTNTGHFLFLEDGIDLMTIVKGVNFYRRGKSLNYALDYIPITSSEYRKAAEPFRWVDSATCPVMLSTMEDGKIVRGLAGIPSEGPVLFVGYHMLLGIETIPLTLHLMDERNIILRALGHPMMFKRPTGGNLLDISIYDIIRLMGAVPASNTNFYKLMSSKSHILLYPGGMREALHRKGEEYKLFWPEQTDFVRVAARFGAKIIPFGVVGEDDIGQVVIDYNDLMRIPYFRNHIVENTKHNAKVRTDNSGEVGNQPVHMPGILPKLPGRFYYLFGKPIDTQGRNEELREKEKAHELYLHVKSEVESYLAYLKEKRKSDPYRNILARLFYRATHGFTSQVPTFDL